MDGTAFSIVPCQPRDYRNVSLRVRKPEVAPSRGAVNANWTVRSKPYRWPWFGIRPRSYFCFDLKELSSMGKGFTCKAQPQDVENLFEPFCSRSMVHAVRSEIGDLVAS